MFDIFIALVVGLATGFIFTFFKLPIPASGVFLGVVGIFGVFVGSKIYEYLATLL